MAGDTQNVAYSTATEEKAALCYAGGDTYQPLFRTPVVGVAGGSNSAIGSSLIDIGGGGLAVAWVEGGATQSGELHYTECASNCADGGAWVDLIVDSINPAVFPPQMAIDSSGVRGVAFVGNGNTHATQGAVYAECAGACTSLASWTEGTPLGNQGGGGGGHRTRPGLTLSDSGGSIIRRLSDGQNYLECTGSCTPGVGAALSGWSAPALLPRNAQQDQTLLVGTQGLPRLAVAECSQVFVESCILEPCTNAVNWTWASAATNAECSSAKLDFVLDDLGFGLVSYVANSGDLAFAVEPSDGGSTWTSSNMVTCSGATVPGVLPSMARTPNGGIRVYFAVTAVFYPDGGSNGHDLFMLGP
jgi:hypothetical protein